ncbi:hypothetical protein ACIA8K_12720 [Catenuloplanes sp. NPDC051500]|uniref:hypothetical protein n=1 Tax=Catenuloplanes sp. NPDC051500 TaxID=3363959 RepID=UPI00378C4CE7
MARINVRNADGRIQALVPFNAGNLTGVHVGVLSGGIETGQLPEEYAKPLRDAKSLWTGNYVSGDGKVPADAPVYVVYSYETPIAWVTASRKRVIPDTKYSMTTSRHQGIVRRAWR